LATLHRPANVDDPHAASLAVGVLRETAKRVQVVLPLHPRGRANLEAAGLSELKRVTVCEPLTYLDFTALLSVAEAVLTDSGGVQEESTMLGTPCLTLRPNTERPVTITSGTNRLVSPSSLPSELDEVIAKGRSKDWPTPELWDGHAGERVAHVIVQWLAQNSIDELT